MVSIVIATRNREALLRETLNALAAQQWPRERLEILVADNGSTDGTRAAVASASAEAGSPRVEYLYVGTPGKSHAVNAALARARGTIIALTDDDVLPERDWVAQLVAAFDETGADFVAGRIFPRWECPPPAWMSPALYGVLAIPDNGYVRRVISHDHPAVVPIGANMAVTAAVIARLGGLRTDLGKLEGTLRTGEDHEFFVRMLAAGFRGVYEPRAAVHHWVPRARLDRAYCRRWLYQNGRDVARLGSAHNPGVPRLLGVPRYLWREVVGHLRRLLGATLRNDPATRFAAWVRLLWLAGYIREAWFGRAVPSPAGTPAVSRA